MSTRKKLVREVTELQARYIRFCINNELNEEIPAHEQISLNVRQQKWIDSHLDELSIAMKIKEGKIDDEIKSRIKTPSKEETDEAISAIKVDLSNKGFEPNLIDMHAH